MVLPEITENQSLRVHIQDLKETLQGLERPWSLLAERVGRLAVRELMLGSVFLVEASMPTAG